MNWKAFFQALAAAAIGGAAGTLSTVITDSQHFDLHHVGPIAATGAIIGVVGMLKQSPLPPSVPPALPAATSTTTSTADPKQQ